MMSAPSSASDARRLRKERVVADQDADAARAGCRRSADRGRRASPRRDRPLSDGACGRFRRPRWPDQHRAVVEPASSRRPARQPGDEVGACLRGNPSAARCLGRGSVSASRSAVSRSATGPVIDQLGEDDEIGVRQGRDLPRHAVEIDRRLRPRLGANCTTAARERRSSGSGRMPYSPWNSARVPEVAVQGHRAVGVRAAVGEEIFAAAREGPLVPGTSRIDPAPDDAIAAYR